MEQRMVAHPSTLQVVIGRTTQIQITTVQTVLLISVTDNTGATDTQEITLTINGVNDPVTIGGDTGGTVNSGNTISGTLTATDNLDGLTDGSYFTIESGGEATYGTASIDEATGEWTYVSSNSYAGTDSFTVTITDDDGHTETTDISITVVDTTAPVLTISAGTGNWTDYVLYGDSYAASTSSHIIRVARTSINTYVEQGATAIDAVDGVVTATPCYPNGFVDTSDAGDQSDNVVQKSYVVSYTANDAAGNTVTRTKTIIVVDDALPIITINAGYGTADPVVLSGEWDGTASTSDVVITLNQSETNEYLEMGVSITDEGADGGSINISHEDAVLEITTNKTTGLQTFEDVTETVTTTTVGSHLITYKAQDITGVETVRTKTVNIVDRIPPVITINGARIHYILSTLNGGEATYTDPGIIAKDYAGPGQTLSEILTKDSIPGWSSDASTVVSTSGYNNYTVTYTATDQYGNVSTKNLGLSEL